MRRLSLLLFLVPFLANASLVDFTWTNWDGTISTNDLIITYIRQPSNDGTSTIKGLPRRYATTNGFLEIAMLTGFYTVQPYGFEDTDPVTFEVPNDSNTYDFWSLRRSGGSLFVTGGVLGLRAGQGVVLNPTNGVGFVTINVGGSNGVVAAYATSNGVVVVTNTQGNLFGIGLAFAPQIASLALSNWATLSTNVFYPSNNPAGFISSNAVAGLLGYQTNAITTNSPTGMTNVVRSIAGSAGSLAGLSDVKLSSPGNGQRLTYRNGNWTNEAGATVSSVGISMPSEFSVTGSPVVDSGTLTVAKATQAANLVYAGPTNGSQAQPTFRALVAADIPANVLSTVWATNIGQGGVITQSILGTLRNAGLGASIPNGYVLLSSNGTNVWTTDASTLVNLDATKLFGIVPAINLGSLAGTPANFLRGDQTWANVIVGPFRVAGNFTNTGNVSLDGGAILSDGFGRLTAVKFIGAMYGQGFGLTNVSSTNLIDSIADARLSNNIARLNVAQLWTANQEFQPSVQFDSGITVLGQGTFTGSLVGGTSSAIGSSNRFEIVNAQGRKEFEVQTNGSAWFTTNHFFFIDWDGSLYSAGNSNHLVHQLISESQIGANSFVSQNYFGNGSGLSNILTANIAGGMNYITNLNGFGTNTLFKSNAVNSADMKVRMLYDSQGSPILDWSNPGILVPTADVEFAGNIFVSGDSILGDHTSGTATYCQGPFIRTNGSPYAFNAGSTSGWGWTIIETNGVITGSNSVISGTYYIGGSSNGVSGVFTADRFSAKSFTNTLATVSTVASYDANHNTTNIPNGGANTFLQGTTPPSYSQVSLTAGVSGILPLANGGLGASLVDPNANKILAWDDTDNANGYWTLGTGFSYNHSTHTITSTAGTGSDTSAWHQDGDQVASPTHAYVVGPTNGNVLEFRMVAGAAGGTVGRIEADAGPNVNLYWGLSNGAISAVEFQCLIAGGQHNTINTAGVTADSILGGQFNFIDSGGGGNYGATIIGGASNHVAGTGSYAMGVGARAVNDYSFVGCFLPNRTVTTSGSGGDNGKVLLAFSNAGVEFTNGNDASICGDLRLFGQALYSTNCAEARSSTFGWTNATGNFGLLWMTTNSPYAGRDLKFVNGSLGGSNAVVLGTQVKPQAFQIDTNGNTRLEGNVTTLGTITGSGAGLTSIPWSANIVQYSTNIASHFADVGNSTTSDTTLYSDSIPGNTLGANGNKLVASYGLNTVAHATATRQIKLFFGGTSILDTGALVYPSAAGNISIEAMIIRDSSTSIRYKVNLTATGSNPTNFVTVGKLTGLTLSSANTLELHGQAGAAGAASNDIVATIGNVDFKP